MKWLAALLLFVPQAGDDKAAQDLLKAVREKIEKAKSLRVEVRHTVTDDNRTLRELVLSIRIRGADRWALEVQPIRPGVEQEGLTYSVFCDGKGVLAVGTDHPGRIRLEGGAQVLRSLLAVSSPMWFEQYYDQGGVARLPPSAVTEVRDGGTETFGDLRARVIEYTFTSGKVRLLVDPATLRPLKKEIVHEGKTTETYSTFAFDEDLPDDEFSYESPRRLARVRAAQLAKSVELYAAFTGRYPRSLDDLVRRPADLEPEIFWPDGGFVLGGVVSKDPWGRAYELRVEQGRASIVSLGADGKPGGGGNDEDAQVPLPAATRRPVGAPTERVRKHFTARVQIHLLAAAVCAFRDATGELPKKKAALWEGGWLPGSEVPRDPWGDPYRLISDPDRVRIQVRDPKDHVLTRKDLTDEEVRRLDEAARPRLGADERKALKALLDRLVEEDPDARDKAESELKAWGPAVSSVLDERLKIEKDGEARLRIERVRKAVPARRLAWVRELATLRATVLVREEVRSDAALLQACQNNLLQLWKMQMVYISQFGGRMKKMPDATGKDFWLALSKTRPPLIDEDNLGIFVCPASETEAKADVCTYRGPAQKVMLAGDADPVGMCDDDSHGEVVVILRKSGDVLVVSRGGPEHEEALRKTKP